MVNRVMQDLGPEPPVSGLKNNNTPLTICKGHRPGIPVLSEDPATRKQTRYAASQAALVHWQEATLRLGTRGLQETIQAFESSEGLQSCLPAFAFQKRGV